jgi:hypothetical protein
MLIKKTFIYVLRLLGDKYYIGKSENPNIRLSNHFTGYGTNWTKKNRPLEVVEMVPQTNIFHEDMKTIYYMNLYGIDNVRGGSFSDTNLSSDNINTINKIINTANNRCFLCASDKHYSSKCSLRKTSSRFSYKNKKF